MVTVTVVPADSPRWRVVEGDIHGTMSLPSDATGCAPDGHGVLFLAGQSSSAELTFAGSLILYGMFSSVSGPINLEVDGVEFKTLDEHEDTGGPPRCLSMAFWPPSGLDVVQGATHVLRVVYTGDSEHRAFIVNATILADIPGAADPSDTVVAPPPTLPYPQPPFFPTETEPVAPTTSPDISAGPSVLSTSSSTGISPSSAPVPNNSASSSASASLSVILAPVLVGVALAAIAAFGLYHTWKRRRAMRAPSAAFRAENHGGVLWSSEKNRTALASS